MVRKGCHHTKESIEKIKQNTRGKTRSLEARKNISIGHKGIGLGRVFSEEHKQRISEGVKKYYMNKKNNELVAE